MNVNDKVGVRTRLLRCCRTLRPRESPENKEIVVYLHGHRRIVISGTEIVAEFLDYVKNRNCFPFFFLSFFFKVILTR